MEKVLGERRDGDRIDRRWGPTTVEEFGRALAREPRWICGRCLEAVAELQKVNIVVWRLKNGSWQREYVFWGKGIYEKLPIIPVILSGGHYFGVQRNQPKQAFPEMWAKDFENVLVVQSCVDENITEISKGIRGGVAGEQRSKEIDNQVELLAVNGFSTPSKEVLNNLMETLTGYYVLVPHIVTLATCSALALLDVVQ